MLSSLRTAAGRARPAQQNIGSARHGATQLPRVAAWRVRAVEEQQADKTNEDQAKVAKVMKDLQDKGFTKETARKVLKTWAGLGAKDSDQLRKLLLSRSQASAKALIIQTLLDSFATGSSLYLGTLLAQAEGLPGNIILSYIANCAAAYYAIQVALELGALIGVAYTIKQYGADAGSVLAAVQQLAGEPSGISVVDRAALAVNSLKVAQTLDSIFDIVSVQQPGSKANTLANLSALLTLSRAKEVYGFEPAKFGLTDAQAADIALVFAKYDANDDGRLELRELRTMCDSLLGDCPLDEPEWVAALAMMDTNKDGYVAFDEFVAWWVEEQKRAAKDSAAAAAGAK